MLHTSVDFPSHLAILLEAAILGVGLLLAIAAPRASSAAAHRLLARIPRLAGRSLPVAAAIVALLGTGLTTWVLGGHPIPGCPDEHAYLLAAETFASGRLTNPPVAESAVVAQHCLSEPFHQSKYPPGQSLILAIGFLVGHPGFALWLQAALLAAAAAWCFTKWFPPTWALLATMLLVLRLAIGSYWNQTYWGGSVAAAAGFLLWGGVAFLPAQRGRRISGRQVAAGLAIGSGLVILAVSRPYEGFFSAVPLGAWLLLHAGLRHRRRALVTLFVVALLLVTGLSALGYYNHSITGSALRFPHQLYAETSTLPGEFVWERFGTDGKLHWYEGDWTRANGWGWTRAAAALTLRRAAQLPWFLIGPALSVGLLLSLVHLTAARIKSAEQKADPKPQRRPQLSLAAVSVALVLVSHGLVEAYFPHYSAPATAPLWLLAIAALRSVVMQPHAVSRWTPTLLPLALAVQLASTVFQVPGFRHDAQDTASIRHELTAELEAQGGRHLVLVAPGHSMAVYNAPRPWDGNVVWAIDPGGAGTAQLLAKASGRTLWQWRGEYGRRLELLPTAPRQPDSAER